VNSLLLLKILIATAVFHGGIRLFFPWEASLNDANVPVILIGLRDIVYASVVAGLLILAGRITLRGREAIFSILVILIIAIGASHLNKNQAEFSHQIFRNLLMYAPLAILIPNVIKTVDQVSELLVFFERLTLLAVFFSLVTYFIFEVTYFGRLYGTFSTPNVAAVICVFVTVARFSCASNGLFSANVYGYAVVLVCLFLIALTGAFTAWAALAFCMLFLLRDARAWLYFLIIFSCAVLVYDLISDYGPFNNLIARIDDVFFSGGSSVTTLSGRLEQYELYFERLRDELLVDLLFGPYDALLVETNDSMYLQLVNSIGVFGLMIYLGLLFLVFWQAGLLLARWGGLRKGVKFPMLSLVKSYVSAFRLLIGAFLIVVFPSVSILFLYPVNAIFFLFAGLIFALSRIVELKSVEPQLCAKSDGL
jgi:hypothetical protein